MLFAESTKRAIIGMKAVGDSYEEQIKEIEDGKFRYMSGDYDFIDSADLTIIDDSREEVGGE